jgi:peroxiredoxin
MVARLVANNVGQSAPQPGEPMPDFILPDEGGRLVRLTDLVDKGPVVLSFHRGHWCPYCRLNADGLAKIAPDVESLGAQIVAISPEKSRYGAELKSYAQAPFPILADIDNGYALELNLLFWVGDETRKAMQARGRDIVQYQGNETWMLPIPATFIVGRDGVVNARYIDPDYRKRMDLDELLAALKSAL